MPERHPETAFLSASRMIGTTKFPETQSEILREAADGVWERFLGEYLRPCWREIVLSCRARRILLGDAEDLFQELALRLMKEGWSRDKPGARSPPQPSVRGNLPARYLRHRDEGSGTAKFRTFLKCVIRNLVLERVRQRQRWPQSLAAEGCRKIETWLEETVSEAIDRQWLADCLLLAARHLREESARARTRGKRRMFDLLYRSITLRQSAAAIAREYGVDRSVIAEMLPLARQRFLMLLSQVTEIDGVDELQRQVASVPETLLDAFEQAHAESLDDHAMPPPPSVANSKLPRKRRP